MTTKEKFRNTFSYLHASSEIHEEVRQMTSQEQDMKLRKYRKRGSRIAAAVLVATLMIGMGVFAAGHYFGILDFAGRAGRSIPESAAEQIVINPDMDQNQNNAIVDLQVREALCDSESIALVCELSAREKGKYLLVPEDALPEDNMSNWTALSDQKAGEYAEEHKLTMINMGCIISNMEKLGIFEQSMDFRSVSDDVMDIFITCGVQTDVKNKKVEITATARQAGTEDVMRLSASMVLQDVGTTKTIHYEAEAGPQKANSGEGLFFKIQRADVIQTDLGTYVDIYFTDENVTLGGEDNDLEFRIVDSAGKAVDSFGGSGVKDDGDGYRTRIMLNKINPGEELNIEAYSIDSGSRYGLFKFKKAEN